LLFDVRFQTNKVIKQSLKNGGLLVTRALARRDRARQNKRIVPRLTRAAGSGILAFGFRQKPHQNSKAVGGVSVLTPDAVFREGNGAVELAVGGAHTFVPLMRHRGPRSQPDHKNIQPAQSASSGISATGGTDR
jgi:hypothetical protein